jgi:predicted Fe-Mo cluster-binding NifX family protein
MSQTKQLLRIAVATSEGRTISDHFGRSPFFAVFDVQGTTIVNQSMRPNTFTRHFQQQERDQTPREHHHGEDDPHAHHSAAEGLADCTVVISHGMGRKAWEDLRGRGIEMIITDETDVEKAVTMYLAGELKDRVERLH